MTYQHLSQNERYQIQALLKAGHAISRIAEIIGRQKSTVGRELTRNVGLKG
jgi:IS30 family transposase